MPSFSFQSQSFLLPSSIPHNCVATLQHVNSNPILVQLHLVPFHPTQTHSGFSGLAYLLLSELSTLNLRIKVWQDRECMHTSFSQSMRKFANLIDTVSKHLQKQRIFFFLRCRFGILHDPPYIPHLDIYNEQYKKEQTFQNENLGKQINNVSSKCRTCTMNPSCICS